MDLVHVDRTSAKYVLRAGKRNKLVQPLLFENFVRKSQNQGDGDSGSAVARSLAGQLAYAINRFDDLAPIDKSEVEWNMSFRHYGAAGRMLPRKYRELYDFDFASAVAQTA